MTTARTVFLLSPANLGGVRGRLLLRPDGTSAMAARLHATGAPIGDVFSFVSGLYFRGKLTYARAFAGPHPAGGVLVIAPGLGLIAPERVITLDDVRAIAAIGVSLDEPRFRGPFERDVLALAASLAPDDQVVLLGSIATGKYLDVLEGALGERLRFPGEFVGRGDMSRGGLMLRCVLDRRELGYVAVAGAVRHGPRPPRLERLR